MAKYKEGFYVPGSMLGSYVANKRTDEGTPYYEAQEGSLSTQKQAALQSLNKNYANTIENAYATYLANKQGVLGSNMGEGFVQQYIQNQQQALVQNVAQANQSAAQARTQLEQQELQASEAIHKQYEAEVSNLDRIGDSLAQYRRYLQSLSGDKQRKYFTKEQDKMKIADLYDVLLNAQPQSLKDSKAQAGMTYLDWAQSQLKGTDEDTQWYNWMKFGGLQDFMKGTKAVDKENKVFAEQRAQAQKQAELDNKASEITNKYKEYNWSNSDTLFGNQVAMARRNNYRKVLIDEIKREDYKTWAEYYQALQEIDNLIIPDKIVKQVENVGYLYSTPEQFAKEVVRRYKNYQEEQKSKAEQDKKKGTKGGSGSGLSKNLLL